MNNYVFGNISAGVCEEILKDFMLVFPNFTEKEIPYCNKSCQLTNQNGKITFAHYNSGKLMLQGNCADLPKVVLDLEVKFKLVEENKKKELKKKEISSGESNIDADFFIGFDEAGKGECFGPLILGAVIFDKKNLKLLKDKISDRDIKKLTWEQVEKLYNTLRDFFDYKILRISPWEMDEKNLNDLMDEGYSKLLKQISKDPSREAFFIDNYNTSFRLDSELEIIKSAGSKVILGEKVDQDYVAGALASLVARKHRNAEMLRLSKDNTLIDIDSTPVSFKSGAVNEEARKYLETYRRLFPYAELPNFVRKSWANVKVFEEEYPKSKLALSYFCSNCNKRSNLVCLGMNKGVEKSEFFCSSCGKTILKKDINKILRNKDIIVDTSTVLSRYITKDINSTNYFEGCSFVLTSDIYEEIDSKQPTWKAGATTEIDELKSLNEKGLVKFRYHESEDHREIPIDKKLISVTRALGGIMVTKDSNLAAFSITSGFVIRVVEDKDSYFKQIQKSKRKTFR